MGGILDGRSVAIEGRQQVLIAVLHWGGHIRPILQLRLDPDLRNRTLRWDSPCQRELMRYLVRVGGGS